MYEISPKIQVLCIYVLLYGGPLTRDSLRIKNTYKIINIVNVYRVFRAQADWTLTHTSHEETEHSTIEASLTLDGVTLTDPLIK
jgi:hypothetical protein